MKRIVSLSLLFLFCCAFSSSVLPVKATPPAPKIVVFYFHTTQRCATCRKIEALSRESVEKSFGKELQSGLMEFRPVNIDEPAHKHYVDDFKLYTKSLIVTQINGDKMERHLNLPRIWELVYSPDQFAAYVKNEITRFIGEKH